MKSWGPEMLSSVWVRAESPKQIVSRLHMLILANRFRDQFTYYILMKAIPETARDAIRWEFDRAESDEPIVPDESRPETIADLLLTPTVDSTDGGRYSHRW